jgi:hypothetical protein
MSRRIIRSDLALNIRVLHGAREIDRIFGQEDDSGEA